jgi:ATP-dependent Clp protease ATP-binding subunit ClpB
VAAQNHLADAGYDPVYGARPLKRTIQRELENPIATKILEGAFMEGSLVTVDLQDGRLRFREQHPQPVTDTPAVSATGE